MVCQGCRRLCRIGNDPTLPFDQFHQNMAKSSPRKRPGQKRAPARCTICSERPLRRDCPHGRTKKTTAEPVAGNLSGQFFHDFAVPLVPNSLSTLGGAPTRSPRPALVIRLPPTTPSHQTRHIPLPATPLQQPQYDAPLPPPPSGSTNTSTATSQQSLEEDDFLQQLDPRLHDPVIPANNSLEPGSEIDARDSETDVSPCKGKRRVPSAANAVHGFVDGVGRGNSTWRMSTFQNFVVLY